MSMSTLDYPQVIKTAYNPVNEALKVDLGSTELVIDHTSDSITSMGWVLGAVGRKIEASYPTEVSEIYTFIENSVTVYQITLTYTDSSKDNLSTVERTG